MFFDLAKLIGCQVQATDEPSGKVEDVLVDDILWAVRHVVVADAGGMGTQPASIDLDKLGTADLDTKVLKVTITRDALAEGPDISSDLPVSHQTGGRTGDPHLRSVAELKGYEVNGLDGPVGALEALIADDFKWKIHFAALKTGDWNDSRAVLVAPGLLNHVDHDSRSIHLDVDHDHVTRSPDYDPETPIEDEADVPLVGRVGI